MVLTVEYPHRKPSCTRLESYLDLNTKPLHAIECIIPVGNIPESITCFQQGKTVPVHTSIENASVLIQQIIVKDKFPVECCSSDVGGKRVEPCANFTWPYEDINGYKNKLDGHDNDTESTSKTIAAMTNEYNQTISLIPVTTENSKVKLPFTTESQSTENSLLRAPDNIRDSVTIPLQNNLKSEIMSGVYRVRPTTTLNKPLDNETASSHLPPPKVFSNFKTVAMSPAEIDMKSAHRNMNIVWTAVVIVVGVPLCACMLYAHSFLINNCCKGMSSTFLLSTKRWSPRPWILP